MCKIPDCHHTKSAAMKHKGGTCWDEYQICPCCSFELFGRARECLQSNSRCMQAINKELSAPPKQPDPVLVAAIKLKKKKNQSMGYGGMNNGIVM